jgi:hypothetical protein
LSALAGTRGSVSCLDATPGWRTKPILHLFGIDHERLTLKIQGLDARLTGVESSKVIKGVLI